MSFSKVLDNAAMRGSLEKQNETNNFWNKHYAILNNGFIFFFPEEDDQSLEENNETDRINKNLDRLFSERGLDSVDDVKDRIATEYFSINGCLQVTIESTTCISIENSHEEKCDL